MALINLMVINLAKVDQFTADPDLYAVDLIEGEDLALSLRLGREPATAVETIDALVEPLFRLRARALRDMAAQPEPAAPETEAELAAEREPAL
jgi:hypothetical protein